MVENSNQVEVKRDKSAAETSRAPHIFEPFETLRHEIDRLFDTHLFGKTSGQGWRLPFARPSFNFAAEWTSGPAIDVVEKDGVYELTAELPGLGRENIDIQISGDTLTLRGEKKEEREEKARNRYLTERRYGSFERMFRLPEGVDAERIDASFNKGILKLVLPKTPESQHQARKIEVKER